MKQTNNKPSGYWTRSNVLESALQFKTRIQWKTNQLGAYKSAIRNGWLEEATNHMHILKKDWDLASLKANAIEYQTRSEWKKKVPAAYKAALNKGLLDIVCEHMAYVYKPNGYWTKEKILESGFQYPSIVAWDSAETTALQKARQNGWLKEATAHMSAFVMPVGPSIIHHFLMSHNIHYIPEYRFKDSPEVSKKPFDFYLPNFNLIIEYHGKQHLKGWRDDEESKSTIQLHDKIKKDWAKSKDISFLEIRSWEEKTKVQIIEKIIDNLMMISTLSHSPLILTWRELSKSELKKIESGLAWDKESIIEDALKYQSRCEWMKHSPKAYRFALRHSLADIATKNMQYITEHGKWTKQTILESAKRFTTVSAWRKEEGSAYVKAIKLDCLELAKSHMEITKKANGYWTKEKVLESAKKYTKISEWRIKEPSARVIAMKNGWIDEATAHMPKHSNPLSSKF